MPPPAEHARQPREEDYVRYSPIVARPPIRWPDGARVALWVVPNVEHYEYLPPPNRFRDPWARTPHPDVFTYAARDYGNRVGFWRMLEVFERHGVRPTVSLNVAVLEHFPEIRDVISDGDWEVMSHGTYNTRYLFGMSEEEERAFYTEVNETVARTIGREVKGMLGPAFTATPRTPALMAEAGLIYHADWFVDDQPFPIEVPKGTLVGVPYSRELNDALLFHSPGVEGDGFAQMCRDQFDVLYAEGAESGRVMCIALHPFLIGQPHRIGYLDEILEYVLSHDGVWMATGGEIAQWYIDHHLEEHRAALEAATP